MLNILATIAARGGSKGVRNKNIRPLCGKPLIAHTILQLQKWGKAQSILVTTDSEEIASTAREYGAEAPFLRPSELATDTSAKLPALRHAVENFEKIKNQKFDIILDLDPTAPLRKVSDIEGCVDLFLKNQCKSVFSGIVAHKNPYFNMVEKNKNGYAVLCKQLGPDIIRRQDAPTVYSLNASIYVYQRNFLLDPNTLTPISDQSLIYTMDEIAGVDIDREIDFKYVEFLVRESLWNIEGDNQ